MKQLKQKFVEADGYTSNYKVAEKNIAIFVNIC